LKEQGIILKNEKESLSDMISQFFFFFFLFQMNTRVKQTSQKNPIAKGNRSVMDSCMMREENILLKRKHQIPLK